MKVYINGELYEAIQSADRLSEIVEDLRIECKKENKVLQIMIDGKFVDTILPGQLEVGVGKVEIEKKTPLELVIEGLIESINYLPVLGEGLNESTNHFREGNISKGIIIFEQSIDGLNWLNHLLTGVKVYIVSDERFNIRCNNYQEDVEGFSQIIKELLLAWENEDYVLIADLVEYELIPNLDKCHNFFVEILDQLAGV
ncbi:MAG: hypothetical protein KAX49_00460 [Halanaerobiales bacterium]|nr:hypothetical protein [Halanaerobiales bacterium]